LPPAEPALELAPAVFAKPAGQAGVIEQPPYRARELGRRSRIDKQTRLAVDDDLLDRWDAAADDRFALGPRLQEDASESLVCGWQAQHCGRLQRVPLGLPVDRPEDVQPRPRVACKEPSGERRVRADERNVSSALGGVDRVHGRDDPRHTLVLVELTEEYDQRPIAGCDALPETNRLSGQRIVGSAPDDMNAIGRHAEVDQLADLGLRDRQHGVRVPVDVRPGAVDIAMPFRMVMRRQHERHSAFAGDRQARHCEELSADAVVVDKHVLPGHQALDVGGHDRCDAPRRDRDESVIAKGPRSHA